MKKENSMYSLLCKHSRYVTRSTIKELKKYFNEYAKKEYAEDSKDLRIIKITTIIEEYDDYLRLFKEEV